MLGGQEERDEPENGGGAHAARKHIDHGRNPLLEQQSGDGYAKSEDDIGGHDGHVAL